MNELNLFLHTLKPYRKQTVQYNLGLNCAIKSFIDGYHARRRVYGGAADNEGGSQKGLWGANKRGWPVINLIGI